MCVYIYFVLYWIFNKMKIRYEILMIVSYFLMTTAVLILNRNNGILLLWIPIYFMIGLFLYHFGQYQGELEIRRRLKI